MNGTVPAAGARLDGLSSSGCNAGARSGQEAGPPMPEAALQPGPGRRGGLTRMAVLAALPLMLAGCMGETARPLPELDRAIEQAGSGRAPSLGETVLALISGRGGREQVVLVDLRSRLPLPVPGLNRPDAQPLSVSSDVRGDRLALVRHRQGRTELVLYRRSLASLEPIPLQPDGVPRRVAMDPEGRSLAVEVSRNGLWQIDLITLP
jgi:hypothetical protein